MFETLREDINAVMERDPAAHSRLHVVACYPGLHAIWAYRLAHKLWHTKFRLLALLIAYIARSVTGIEIHPAAQIGPRFFIDHGMGVVIGETAEVGEDVTLYHGVTLGGVSLERGKRHPTLEHGVVVGAGAKVLGAITIGEGSRIGANAVVVKDAPPNTVVVGVPGKPIERQNKPIHPDLQHGNLPDIITENLNTMLHRLDDVECKISRLEDQNGNKTRHASPESDSAAREEEPVA